MSQITTHVLDTALGVPAAGVPVKLSQQVADAWQLLATGTTDEDGRVTDLLPVDKILPAGHYQMYFDTGAYAHARQQACFYPWVEVAFLVGAEGAHYHVPLLLSPYGYATYRGS